MLFDKDLDPTRILQELQFYFDMSINQKVDLLIFDEIQHCPRALTALKYFSEQMPELALCAAGSLIGVYLAGGSFPVGKVSLLDMYPMSFEEFLEGIEKRRLVDLFRSHVFSRSLPAAAHEQLWELWKRYLIVGGLPEAVVAYRDKIDSQYEAAKAARKVQHDLIETYMADIAKHSGKANALHVERLWRNVTQQLARSQNGSAAKFRFKDAVPGLRGAFSGLDPARILQYDFGTYKGYVAENYVAQELRASGVPALYCWVGRTAEVEFLLETPSGVVPLEVKAGNRTQSKSLKVYEERYRPEKSIVLSGRNSDNRGPRLPIYLAGLVSKRAATGE